MGLIQQERWFDRSRKASGGKGPAQGALDEDVQQFVQLANLDTYEYDYLARVKQCVLPFKVAAVAAQNAQLSIFNPAASNLLCFVERMIVSSGVAISFDILGLTPTTGDTTLTVLTRTNSDWRWNLNPLSVTGQSGISTRGSTNAAAFGLAMANGNNFIIPANESIEFRLNWVLPPGWGLNWFFNTVNQAVGGMIWFKERPFDPAELS